MFEMRHFILIGVLFGLGCEQKPAAPPPPSPPKKGAHQTSLPKASIKRAAEPKALYQTDFNELAIDSEPNGWLLDGDFTIQNQQDNRVLHLPGIPLATFNALIHPAALDEKALEKLLVDSSRAGVITARIHSQRKGRRLYSRFGVGLGGAEGFKLLIAANQGQLQLWHHETKLSQIPFDWQTDRWVNCKLAIFPKTEGQWIIQGKAWHDTEPEAWMLGVRIQQEPPVGRPALWGTPYAGKPILYDDVTIRPYPGP